jgi:hypothetical protein
MTTSEARGEGLALSPWGRGRKINNLATFPAKLLIFQVRGPFSLASEPQKRPPHPNPLPEGRGLYAAGFVPFTLEAEWGSVEFWLAATLAALAVIIYVLRSRPIDPERRGRWLQTLNLTMIVAALLAAAALNPVLVHTPPQGSFHLVVALDASESQDRADGGRAQSQARLSELVRTLAGRPGVEGVTGGFVVFGADSRVIARDLPLDQLAGVISRSVETVDNDGSRIDLGLQAALDQIGGRRGAVVLAADGLEVGGAREAVIAAAARLAERGTPIHILERESAAPDLALFAVNAPRLVDVNAQTSLRVFVGGGRAPADGDMSGNLSVAIDGQPEQRRAIAGADKSQFGVSAPLAFEAPGLHYATVRYAGQNSEVWRRVFTLAARKPRLLAVGPADWADALDRDLIDVEKAHPGDQINPGEYDVMVLNGVRPGDLGGDALARMAGAVSKGGLGLFVINGRHAGRDDEPSLLSAYDKTAIAPLLPLHPMKDANQDQRGVRLYVMIDESGSMMMSAGGQSGVSRIDAAHGLIRRIIGRMGDGDQLSIMNFDGLELLAQQPMTEAGKSAANASLSIRGGSASCPIAALQRLQRMNVVRPCSLIVITDTEVDCHARYQGCSTQTFGVNYAMSGRACPDVYNRLGKCEFYAGGRVALAETDGPEQKNFVLRGDYAPEAMHGFESFAAPPLTLRDSLTARETPKAELALMRRGARVDPVLAYLRAGTGSTGVLTTEIPRQWQASPEGRKALNAWIGKFLAWPDRDRYDIAVVDRGANLELRIGLNADKAGRAPSAAKIEAQAEMSSGEVRPLYLREHPLQPLMFTGELALDPQADPGATLVLRETDGEGRVRVQRIPFRTPPATEGPVRPFGAERQSYGLDRALLEDIRKLTGGEKASADSIALGAPAVRRALVLWPGLATLAACLFAALIVVMRWAKR